MIKLGSRLCFFRSGLITPVLKDAGTIPLIRVLFIICSNIGLRIGKRSLINLEGIGLRKQGVGLEESTSLESVSRKFISTWVSLQDENC